MYDRYGSRSRFKYWFHHPTTRLLNIILSTALSCVLFSKDPIGFSPAEAQIPILGPAGKFLFYPYPFLDGWELAFKTLLAIMYLMAGMMLGKYVIHDYLFRDTFKWAMFNEDKGSWFCMFIASIWSLYSGCFVFNLIDRLFHPHIASVDHEEIGDGLGFTFAKFHQFLSPFSLTFSIFVFIVILDDILQDRTDLHRTESVHLGADPYPNTWKFLKKCYRSGHGVVRIFMFWIFILCIFFLHGFVLEYETIDSAFIHSDVIPELSEVGRSVLASVIFSLELVSIMQDEEFPRFAAIHRVHLVGMTTSRIYFALMNYEIIITGKWFNYSFVFWTIGTDLIMFYNQFTYDPSFYHQSVDDEGYIIYSGGVLEKSKYNGTKPYLLWFSIVPMLITSIVFVICLIIDANSKKKEKSLRSAKSLVVHSQTDDSVWLDA